MSVEADEIWAILKGISETNKELSKAHQEFKEEQKALQAAQVETDRKLEKVSDLLGSIGQNQGDVAEEFFFNCSGQLFSDTAIGCFAIILIS